MGAVWLSTEACDWRGNLSNKEFLNQLTQEDFEKARHAYENDAHVKYVVDTASSEDKFWESFYEFKVWLDYIQDDKDAETLVNLFKKNRDPP